MIEGYYAMLATGTEPRIEANQPDDNPENFWIDVREHVENFTGTDGDVTIEAFPVPHLRRCGSVHLRRGR